MYEAFPRSDYYGSSVTVPDIQKLNFIAFRHSGLGNPRLALWQHSFDRLSDTTFVLYCLLQSRCNLFCFQFSKEELKVLQYGVNNYLPPQFRVIPLGLSFNQSRLYPHIYRFISWFSRILVVIWLISLSACYTPCPVSLSDKPIDDRLSNTRLTSCYWRICQRTSTGAPLNSTGFPIPLFTGYFSGLALNNSSDIAAFLEEERTQDSGGDNQEDARPEPTGGGLWGVGVAAWKLVIYFYPANQAADRPDCVHQFCSGVKIPGD